MKKYNKDSVCRKCGSSGALSRHKEYGHYFDGEFIGKSRILRTCFNCGFSWKEIPLDSEEEEDVDGQGKDS